MPLNIADFGWMIVVDALPMFSGISDLVVMQDVMVEFAIEQEPLFPNNFVVSNGGWVGMQHAGINA